MEQTNGDKSRTQETSLQPSRKWTKEQLTEMRAKLSELNAEMAALEAEALALVEPTPEEINDAIDSIYECARDDVRGTAEDISGNKDAQAYEILMLREMAIEDEEAPDATALPGSNQIKTQT